MQAAMDDSKKSTALIKKRDSDMALMPPPPAPKRIKRPATVLDEETYLNGLSHIIARDYFPGFVETEAKQEFLDALDSKDDSWIQDAGKRLQNAMNGKTPARRGVAFPDQTPRDFIGDTPRTETEVEPKSNPPVDLNMSLGAFQAKYTSEDNESFSALLDKQNTKSREKHAYLWTGNKIPSARQIAYQEREAKRIEAAKTSNALTLWSEDNRPAMPNFAKTVPRNTFMFNPESVEDDHVTVAQEAEAKSNAPPKSIVHSNTRIEEPNLPEAQVPASPSLSAINDAIAGRPHLNESSAGWETPRVRGYAFVDAEPTPAEMHAYEGEPSDAAAMLSHLTKGVDASPNPFNIKESGDREKLHHRLVDKTKEKQGRVGELLGGITPGKTPTPKFKSAPQKGNLTPAARLLYNRMKGSTPRGHSSTTINNFDLTPSYQKPKKGLLPGVTPRSKSSRLQD
jgi:protein DGCR14